MRISDWSSDVCSSDLLSWAEGEHLLDNGSLTPVDRSYLQAALAATKGGVKRIHLVGHDDGALLRELYTRDGIGLMLYSDADYEATRDATIEDVGGVLALIQPLEQQNVLVARSDREHTSELQSLMRSSYAGFCLRKQV